MARYGTDFFEERHGRTQHAARTVLEIVAEIMPKIGSAVDVGCGVGTWLSVLAERGTAEIQGVDGHWVDEAQLVIPRGAFLKRDLGQPFTLARRYDLAISLEVAEHLPPERAASFVRLLTDLADVILFSAAIPLQGGRGHVNEQWPEFWVGLFQALRYEVFDVIRPRIWADTTIPSWYRQNTLLLVRGTRVATLNGLQNHRLPGPLSIVHPEIYLKSHRKRSGLRRWLNLVRRR